MIPTTGLNENEPSGSSDVALGDNAIRRYKTQVREIMEVNHDFPSSGNSLTAGQHKKVTLQEQADIGSGAVSATILGSQTIDGKGELVYTDEDDNDIQLTKAGKVCLNQVSLASVAGIMSLIYPVGSFYANDAVSTNPATLLGIGTWVAVEEQVIGGYKSGSTEFGTIGTYAGGEKTHSLTEAELAAHTHQMTLTNTGGTGYVYPVGNNSGNQGTYTTTSAGSGTAHNNIQPTYVAYLWRRTS